MTEATSLLILLPIFYYDTQHRLSQEIKQTRIKFLTNLVYNSTLLLPFETYPNDLHITPLIREHEHHDSDLCYIDTDSLTETRDEHLFP